MIYSQELLLGRHWYFYCLHIWLCATFVIINYEEGPSKCCTSSTRWFGSAVRCPCRLLSQPYAGGSSNTQQVDGVRLQVFQEMLCFLCRQLDLRDGILITGAKRQAIGRDPTTTQLFWKGLPRHLDVCWTVASQAELRGTEGNCGPTRQESCTVPKIQLHHFWMFLMTN